jgi:hypothetical protein
MTAAMCKTTSIRYQCEDCWTLGHDDTTVKECKTPRGEFCESEVKIINEYFSPIFCSICLEKKRKEKEKK